MQPASENRQNWVLLIIYSGYRALLSMLLCIMFLLTVTDPVIGQHEPTVFMTTAGVYACYALILLLMQLFSRRLANPVQIFTALLIDILALALLHHSSSDDANGIALLILPAIAAGNMLLSPRLGVLLAAMASIAMIADGFYRVFYEDQSSTTFFGAGLLGMAFFTTSIVVQYLTRRIASAQELAETRRTDVQQLLNISQRIVQNMRTGILVVNTDGVIRLINDAAAEMLHIRYTNSSMPQRAPRSLLDTLRGNGRQNEQIRIRESGRLLQINRAELKEGDLDNSLLFIEDVSQLSQQAQQLKLASLGQFTASIAHEIRNPLGAISHAAQLLAESTAVDNTDRRLIDIVQQQSARMNSVIENILQLSRRKSPQPEHFDLKNWLTGFAEEYREAASAPCELAIDSAGDDFTVNVDPDQLHQILTTIIDNGLRHSESATGERRVALQLHIAQRLPAPVLDVVDEGEGVRDENLYRIFEPFFTTEANGTGLGLYICKELCESNQIHLAWLRKRDLPDHVGKSCFRLSFSHPERRHAIE